MCVPGGRGEGWVRTEARETIVVESAGLKPTGQQTSQSLPQKRGGRCQNAAGLGRSAGRAWAEGDRSPSQLRVCLNV